MHCIPSCFCFLTFNDMNQHGGDRLVEDKCNQQQTNLTRKSASIQQCVVSFNFQTMLFYIFRSFVLV